MYSLHREREAWHTRERRVPKISLAGWRADWLGLDTPLSSLAVDRLVNFFFFFFFGLQSGRRTVCFLKRLVCAFSVMDNGIFHFW